MNIQIKTKTVDESPSTRAATRDLEQTKQLQSHSQDKISQLQEENEKLKELIGEATVEVVKLVRDARQQDMKQQDKVQELRQKVKQQKDDEHQLRNLIADLEAALCREKQANATREAALSKQKTLNNDLKCRNIKFEDQIKDFETLYETVKKAKRFWKQKFTETASQQDYIQAHAELCGKMKW